MRLMILCTAGVAALAAAAVYAATAEGQPSLNLQPFHHLKNGEPVRCLAEDGCVAMTEQTFRAVLRMAIERGAHSCGRTT